jgi:hypothetical protein
MHLPHIKLFITLFPILKKIASINAKRSVEVLQDSVFFTFKDREKTVHLEIYFDNFNSFYAGYSIKKMQQNGYGPINLIIGEIKHFLES